MAPAGTDNAREPSLAREARQNEGPGERAPGLVVARLNSTGQFQMKPQPCDLKVRRARARSPCAPCSKLM